MDRSVTPWRVPLARDPRRFAWQSSSPGGSKRTLGNLSAFATSVSRIGRNVDFATKDANDIESGADSDIVLNSSDQVPIQDDLLVTLLEIQPTADSGHCEQESDSKNSNAKEVDGEISRASIKTTDETLRSISSSTPCETSSPLGVSTSVLRQSKIADSARLGTQFRRNPGEAEESFKLRVANRAVNLLSGALFAAIGGNYEELELIFPETSPKQACDSILDFFNRQLGARSRGSVPKDSTNTACCLQSPTHSVAPADPASHVLSPQSSPSYDEMTKKRSTRQTAAADDEDPRAAGLRAAIQKKEEELAKLAQQAIKFAADPVKKATTKMEIKRVERLLLNDTLALAVHDSSGKFTTAITSRVENLESRQDAHDEEAKLNKAEMNAMQKRLAQLEEENRTAKIERREILRLVDAVDNNSRKQSLVLHGLRPDEDARSFFPGLEQHIDRVYQVGQPTTSARGSRHTVVVHFDTVSRCEAALELLNSNGFDQHRSRIGFARNTSTLSRIGGSRMRMLGERLVAMFPGAVVKKGYVSYKDERFSAFDFAMQQITVDGVVIDIDNWVRNCEDCEENNGVKARVDGRVVSGVRTLRGAANSNKRRRSPSPAPGNGRDGRAGRVGNLDRRTAAASKADDVRQGGASRQSTAGPARAVGKAAEHGRREQRRGGNDLPPFDGKTRGGVQAFVNGGYTNHGGNGQRNKVMNVSRGHGNGYPPRVFVNNRYVYW